MATVVCRAGRKVAVSVSSILVLGFAEIHTDILSQVLLMCLPLIRASGVFGLSCHPVGVCLCFEQVLVGFSTTLRYRLTAEAFLFVSLCML